MAEDIDKEVLANAQAELLAISYIDCQKRAFNPIVLPGGKVDPSLAEYQKEMADLLRSSTVNLFLKQYKTYGGQKQIDGAEYEGQLYGKGIGEAAKAGREPVVIKWEDLPKTLGFEQFLPKK